MSSDKTIPNEKSSVNISEAVIQKLIENLLLGKTTILPVHVIETMVGAKIKDPSSKSNIATAAGVNTENDIEFGISKNTIEMLEKHVQTNANTTAASIASSSEFDDEKYQPPPMKFYDIESLAKRIYDASFPDEITTRTVTPNDLQRQDPVSEQLLCAKRVLKHSLLETAPPDFSHLTPDLEEAFLVSTAHLTRLITSSFEQIYEKINLAIHERARKSDFIIKEILSKQLEEVNINCKQLQEEIKATGAKAKVAESIRINTEASTNKVPIATTPLVSKPYNVISNFETFLTRSKMPAEEVEKHGILASKMIGKFALDYMAQFGYVPKYKK